MIGIYKITSPKNRIYIGQSLRIEDRFYEYNKMYRCKSQIKLYRSLVKYLPENHIFEIVEECSIELLNERERYYQEFYDVLNKGLNCKLTQTKDKSGKLSQETKDKISLSNKGKKRTQETKNKLSQALTGRKFSDEHCLNMKNRIISQETRNKMSESRKLGDNPLAKSLICTETLKIWTTLKECAEEIGIRYNLLSRYLTNVHPNKTTIIYLKDYETK